MCLRHLLPQWSMRGLGAPWGLPGQLLTAHRLRLESRSFSALFLFGDVVSPGGNQPGFKVWSLDDQ